MLLLFEWRLYDYGALGDQALSNDIDVLNSDKITAIINNTMKNAREEDENDAIHYGGIRRG